MSAEEDTKAVEVAASRLLGPKEGWFEPAGYRDSLALCVIDSVFSLRARYVTVGRVLAAYRGYRSAQGADAGHDGCTELVQAMASAGGGERAADKIFMNRNRAPGTALLKASVVDRVARALLEAGVNSTWDLVSAVGDDQRQLDVRAAWLGTPGLGRVSWDYLLMLAGQDGIKADTMVRRFVTNAIKQATTVDAGRARRAVEGAADSLGVSQKTLDHAIWRYESSRARTARKAEAASGGEANADQ